MIRARDALAYPRAQLSPEDTEKLRSVEEKIDACIKDSFSGGVLGMEIPSTELSPRLVNEISRLYGGADGGWLIAWDRIYAKSVLTDSSTVVGYRLMMEPKPDALGGKGDALSIALGVVKRVVESVGYQLPSKIAADAALLLAEHGGNR